LKLTPEETKRIFDLAEKLDISFVDICKMALEIGLKELEDKENAKPKSEM
jgi:hypothetical protein